MVGGGWCWRWSGVDVSLVLNVLGVRHATAGEVTSVVTYCEVLAVCSTSFLCIALITPRSCEENVYSTIGRAEE